MVKSACSALAALVVAGSAVSGAPSAPTTGLPPARLPIVLAANGCGPGFFRTIAGNCVPNARVEVGPGRAMVLPPPCPRGFRRDPDPRRPLCYPVF